MKHPHIAVVLSSFIIPFGPADAFAQEWCEKSRVEGREASDQFGRAVGLSGPWLLVGAVDEGLDGRIEFYQATEDQWELSAVFNGTQDGERYGSDSVGIDGGVALVGASKRWLGQDPAYGAVEFLALEDGDWNKDASWDAPGFRTQSLVPRALGEAVAISGDWAVVGAYNSDFDLDQSGAIDIPEYGVGAAFVFRRVDGTWRHWTTLLPEAKGHFGDSVAIDNDIIAVAAPLEPAVYVYFIAGDAVVPHGRILPPDPNNTGGFSNDSLAVSGELIAIPARTQYFDVNGNGVFDRGTDYGNAGVVRLYDAVSLGLLKEIWEHKLVDRDASDTDRWFGSLVAFEGDRLIVGAPRADDPPLTNVGRVYNIDLSRFETERADALHLPLQAVAGAQYPSAIVLDGDRYVLSDAFHDVDFDQDGIPDASNAGIAQLISTCDEDTDGDGLLDDWELNGIPYTKSNGTQGRYLLDWDEDGEPDCDVDRKDLFVRVTVMDSLIFFGGHLVQAAFRSSPVTNPNNAADGIQLWIQMDDAEVPFEAVTQFPARGFPPHFATIKRDHFLTPAEKAVADDAEAIRAAKLKAYRFCIMVNRIQLPDGVSIGGLGEMPGDDFAINGRYSDGTPTPPLTTAAVFMHELGHNLNLHHGGGDAINGKPNYPSIMSYTLAYQEPWNRAFWELDYSRERLASINEADLTESVPFGLGGTGYYTGWQLPYYSEVPFDSPCYDIGEWGDAVVSYAPLDPSHGGNDLNLDCDVDDVGIAVDLTFLAASGLPGSVTPSPGQTLHGHDDWSNLQLPVTDGSGDFAGAPADDELTEDQVQFMKDNFPVPPGVCEADWNDDGAVNTLDVLGFLNDWAASHYRADMNLDGEVNTLDVLAFLNLWSAGCP